MTSLLNITSIIIDEDVLTDEEDKITEMLCESLKLHFPEVKESSDVPIKYVRVFGGVEQFAPIGMSPPPEEDMIVVMLVDYIISKDKELFSKCLRYDFFSCVGTICFSANVIDEKQYDYITLSEPHIKKREFELDENEELIEL